MNRKETRLKFICKFGYGDAPPKDKQELEKVPVFGSNGQFSYTDIANTKAPVIVIGRKGSYGKINWSNVETFASDTTFFVDSSLTSHNLRWLYWSLQVLKLDEGSNEAAVPGLNRETAYQKRVFVTSPERQTKIADYLDRETTQIDNLIAAKEQMLTLLEEKREALISHAVTRGLDPNVAFKRSALDWLGDIPQHWEVGKLGYKFSVKARLGWKGLKAEEYVDKGYIFLATPNIKKKEIDFENVNYINAARYFESPEIMLEVGDILVVKDGSTLGIISLVQFLPSPATVNSSIAVLRAKDKLESNFFYYFFTANYTQNVIQRLKDGQGVPHLFQADLKKFNIVIPPLKEQKQICDYLDVETAKFDELLTAIKDSIALLKERRSALITAAVTGQIALEEMTP